MVFTYISPSIRKQRGYDPSEVLGRPIWEFLAPNELEPIRRRVAERFKLLLSDRENFVPEPYETQQFRKDGTTLWTETMANPVFKHEGQLIAFQGVTRDITDRKRVEEDLRESEEKYRLLVENSYDIIYTLNTEGIFTFVSPALTELLGLPPKQLIGQSFQQIVHIDDIPMCLDFLHKVLNTEQRQDGVEYRVKHINGEWRWHRTNAVPFKDETAKVIGLQGIARDITKSKRMEEELRVSEEKFSKAFHLNPDAILITRLVDAKIVSVNEGFKRLGGYTEEELIGKSGIEINIWDNPEDRNRLIEGLKAEGKVDHFEAHFRTKDGDIRYGHVSASIIDLNGEPHILTVAQDITERKRTNKALKESEKKYRLLTENMNDVIWQMTPDTVFTYISPSIEKHMGYEVHEVLGRPLWDFITPDSIEPLTDLLQL